MVAPREWIGSRQSILPQDALEMQGKSVTGSFQFLGPVARDLAALLGAFRSPFQQAGYAPCGHGFNWSGSLAEQRVADARIVEAVVAGDGRDGASDDGAIHVNAQCAPVGGR